MSDVHWSITKGDFVTLKTLASHVIRCCKICLILNTVIYLWPAWNRHAITSFAMMDRCACIRISTRHQFVDKRRWHWTFSIFEHNGGTHSRILTTRLLFNTTTNFFNKIGFQIISSFSVLCEEKKHCCGTSSFSVLCVNMKISLPVMLHWRIHNLP